MDKFGRNGRARPGAERTDPGEGREAVGGGFPPAHRWLFGPASTLEVQFFRYGLVGGAAFAVDFGSLYLLTDFAGLHYLASAALAFLLGLCTNYALSVSWVFPTRNLRSRWLEFLLFGLIGGVGLGLNEVVLWALTEGVGLHYLLSKVGAAGVVFLWNFFARKLSLFR